MPTLELVESSRQLCNKCIDMKTPCNGVLDYKIDTFDMKNRKTDEFKHQILEVSMPSNRGIHFTRMGVHTQTYSFLEISGKKVKNSLHLQFPRNFQKFPQISQNI